jgi:hypothetical protein
MTQTKPKTPRGDQFQGYGEEFQVIEDASELRPRSSVEATSCDRLAVNENIFMRSET